MKKLTGKRQLQIICITLMTLSFITGCNTSAFDKIAARKSIEATDSMFVDLMNKGDATRLAECYTVDALLMMPNKPAIEGRTCQPYKSHDLEGLEGCGLDLNLQSKQRKTKEQEK